MFFDEKLIKNIRRSLGKSVSQDHVLYTLLILFTIIKI